MTTSGARVALIALAIATEPGDVRVGRLAEAHGPVEAVSRLLDPGGRSSEALAMAARLRDADAGEADGRASRSGARIVTRLDREWPTQLDQLGPAAPHALWIAGAADLRLLALRSVAIVGARACTAYGAELAHGWAAELAEAGWCVVSGGAFGIDAAAHRGALAAGSSTVCVLAGGVDVPYPRAHAALLARIADEGLLVSESPPGESVRRQRFLSRNRVIAALTRATLVVEAAERSGTIATARAADAMNRPVLAVPGPVTSPASAGCHRMIRDREAILVSTPAHVVEVLDPGTVRASVLPSRRGPAVPASVDHLSVDHLTGDHLTGDERTVLDVLPVRGSMKLPEVELATGLDPARVRVALGVLELEGRAVSTDDRWTARPPRRGRA